MNPRFFLITIDTEGDDVWNWKPSAPVRTRNAAFLPRFQALCEAFGFKPTYLTAYEMAMDPAFRTFARSALDRGAAEVGLHVHAWNSPPTTGNPAWDEHQAYITELAAEFMRAKMEYLTDLLERTFAVRPVSHRGGRYAFDHRVARILADLGYRVDCSVTPGVSWKEYPGAPHGTGGADFEAFPIEPYLVDLHDVRQPGASRLLEVPVTIRSRYSRRLASLVRRQTGFARRIVRRLAGPSHSWLRPDGRNIDQMRDVVDWALDGGLPEIEFILHSSELMPGGSPTFRTAADIERLYGDLAMLFEHVRGRGVVGATLAEYRDFWGSVNEGGPPREPGLPGSA